MIQTKHFFIKNQEYVKTYSDKGFYIMDKNNILYAFAYDLIDYPKTYVESSKLIKKQDNNI